MNSSDEHAAPGAEKSDVRHLVREMFDEFVSAQSQRSEPAHKAELEEEKRKRETLERRLNELVDENRRSKALAESLERETSVKSELQRHGVSKLDLAYKAVKDEIHREKDGSLTGRLSDGAVPLKDFVVRFLDENPELLPARNVGGSGSGSSPRSRESAPGIDIDAIRPGMSKEDMARVRREIARVAGLMLD